MLGGLLSAVWTAPGYVDLSQPFGLLSLLSSTLDIVDPYEQN